MKTAQQILDFKFDMFDLWIGRLSGQEREAIIKAMEAYAGQFKEAALSPAKQEWVSVKERLPECDTWVLGYSARAFRFSRQMVVLFGQDAFFAKGFELHPDEVTHWKPLDEPALPYTEENGQAD